MLLSTKNFGLKNPGATKLLPKWISPHKVVKKVNAAAYRLDLPGALKIHDVFHVSLLRMTQTVQFNHHLLSSFRVKKSLRWKGFEKTEIAVCTNGS